MGTRSLTFVHDTDEAVLVCMYRQFDGYPEGHGSELASFLAPFRIVNGIPMNAEPSKLANGMGCLAAQMIAHFKTDAGGYYLYPANTSDVGEEYVYHVYDDRVTIINYNDREIFNGSWSEFAKFCKMVGAA